MPWGQFVKVVAQALIASVVFVVVGIIIHSFLAEIGLV